MVESEIIDDEIVNSGVAVVKCASVSSSAFTGAFDGRDDEIAFVDVHLFGNGEHAKFLTRRSKRRL